MLPGIYFPAIYITFNITGNRFMLSENLNGLLIKKGTNITFSYLLVVVYHR